MTEEEPTEEELEEELKKLEDIPYGSPEPEKKDSIFRFFREILHTKDSKKVGNLTDTEIGGTKIGIRHYFNIANYAEVEGLNDVAKYLRDKSEIIAATSMSRKGFLAQLFVTQIKKEQKLSKPLTEDKKRWFFQRTHPQEET